MHLQVLPVTHLPTAGRVLRTSHWAYLLAAWCPRRCLLQWQPWGPGGGRDSLGRCWVSARHLGSQWDHGPARLGTEATLGWSLRSQGCLPCREPPAPSPGPPAVTVARPSQRGLQWGHGGSGHWLWVFRAVWTQVEYRNVLGGSQAGMKSWLGLISHYK